MAMDNPVARVANIVVVQCPYLSTKPTTNNVWLLLIELKILPSYQESSSFNCNNIIYENSMK